MTSTPPPLEPRERAQRWLAEGLLSPGERVLVAVSAGADSTALAWALDAVRAEGLPLDLVLAHLDHGWRSREEAQADAQVVRALAARLGLPLVTAGPPEPPAPGETAARRWRYAALARLAREAGARTVAVGHHLRDQVETVLLRRRRGIRGHGLAGMAASRPLDGGRLRVVRPLLDVHPEALRARLALERLAFREDPTNAGPGARNDVRRRLVALEARAPDALSRLADFASRLRARMAVRHARLREELAAAARVLAPTAVVRVPRDVMGRWAEVDAAEAWRALGERVAADRDGPWFGRRHLERLDRVLKAGGALDLPQGLCVRVTPRRVWLMRRTPRAVDACRLEALALDPARARAAIAALTGDPLRAVLVARGPLRLRGLEEGDAFVPFGRAKDGRRSVDAWLARRGVPRRARASTLVVEAEGQVAWVVGHRIDQGHALAEGPTQRAPVWEVRVGAAD